MGGARSTFERYEKCTQNFGSKIWREEPTRRRMSRSANNIKMDLKRCEGHVFLDYLGECQLIRGLDSIEFHKEYFLHCTRCFRRCVERSKCLRYMQATASRNWSHCHIRVKPEDFAATQFPKRQIFAAHHPVTLDAASLHLIGYLLLHVLNNDRSGSHFAVPVRRFGSRNSNMKPKKPERNSFLMNTNYKEIENKSISNANIKSTSCMAHDLTSRSSRYSPAFMEF
jgi:hypothetical protein